jgi:type I restriction enzyme S subunit
VKRFLYHWFEWDKENIKAEHGTGSTMIHVTKGDMEARPISIPPIREQQRIAAKIDNLTGMSKRARGHLDHLPRLVEKYKQAVLAAAFRGDLSPDEAFDSDRQMQLENAIDTTFYGPRIAKTEYVKIGIPTVRTTDMTSWGELNLQDPPQVRVSPTDQQKWELRDGDLIITRTGTIGKCAVYTARIGPALPSAYLIRVRLRLNLVEPRFVLLFMLSPSGQRQLLDGRTAVAQPNINASAITSLRLPIPSLDIQRAIVQRIDIYFAWIDRLASNAISARRLVDHLDQATLAKAFRGELVLRDPADEPASVLVERIRAERATSGRARGGGATPR